MREPPCPSASTTPPRESASSGAGQQDRLAALGRLQRHRLLDVLVGESLGETALVLAASRGYLDAHRCIVFSRDREPYPCALRVGREALSYRPRGSLLTGDAEHVRAAGVNGLGISQAPLWLLEDEIRAGRVQVLLPRLQPEPLPIHLVHAAGRRVPMRVRVLIDFLVEIFASDERARR